MEYKWAEFLTGGFASPVIRIDNATDLKNFHKLIKQNKLAYYEYFIKFKYTDNLKALLNNTSDFNTFYRQTNHWKSFLIEYQFGKGFTVALLNAYDEVRQDESEWKIYTMSEIMEELSDKK